EIAGAVLAQLALGQRARLLDAVLRTLVRQRQVRAPVPQPDPREEPPHAARRGVAPALFGEERPGDVVVERPLGATEPQTILLPAEATPLGLRHDLTHLGTAPGDDVEDSAERVAAENGAGAAKQLDAFDVVERQQIEVDLLHGRLVHPYAVHEHADPLRRAGDRGALKAADREVHLEG